MSKTNETKSRVNLPDDNKVSLEITEAFQDPDSLNIGQSFMEARARKGLTQEQASKALKVRTQLINDFEEGVDLNLPGLAYRVGFVRSYANLVDLDSDYYVEAYKKNLNKEDSKISYNFLEVKKEKKSYYPIISLAVFLFFLIGYSAWYYNDVNSLTEDKKNQNLISENQNKEKKQLDYVKVEDQLITDEKRNLVSNVDDNLEKEKDNNVLFSNNDEKPLLIIEQKPENSEKFVKKEILMENKNLPEKIVNQASEVSAIANERDPESEMILKSTGNSWVEIEDMDGSSLMTRLMRPGETYVIPKTKGLTLSTGNAGVLSLSYGNVYIPSLGEIGEIISSRPLNVEAFNQR